MSIEPGRAPGEALRSTRRELLSRTGVVLLGGGALLAGGCGHAARRTLGGRPAFVPVSRGASALDVDILNGLLGSERLSAAAYTAVIPLLFGHDRRTARNFLGAELAHANELITLIHHHHGTPVPPRNSYPLGSPGSRAEWLALLARLEQMQIAAYLGAIPLVAPGALRANLAAILGSEAQHLALLRKAAGRAPLTGPFVTASG